MNEFISMLMLSLFFVPFAGKAMKETAERNKRENIENSCKHRGRLNGKSLFKGLDDQQQTERTKNLQG